MGQILRRLGLFGANLPTKKAVTVRASEFSIGGIIGRFERKFDKSFEVQNLDDFREIFGDQVASSFFGFDAVNGFFENIVGVTGKMFIKSHVGFDGTVIDATTATSELDDQEGAPVKTLRLKDAFKDELGFGVSGNRTGYQIVNGFRFDTSLAATVSASATSAVLDSVIGIKIGDIIRFDATGAGGATIFKKITTVTESTKTITWVGAFDGTATGVINDVTRVIGFQLKSFRKSINGIVTEVETDLGKIFCTMEPEVTDFYVQNVHNQNRSIKAEDLAISPTEIEEAFPANVSTTEFLGDTNTQGTVAGTDGTTPTISAHWQRDIDKLANDPIRFIANPDTTDETVQRALEAAMKGRSDNPKVIFNIAADRTKSQLLDIGHRFQRSDDVLGVIAANHLEIEDPFTISTIAPPRVIPNVGHVMGLWVRSIGLKGIHFVPATKDNPILGITGIKGDQFLDDDDRTDLVEAGINLIQFIQGSGNVLRNFFTPSTATEFLFGNGILMREFIKVSAIDSLQNSENTPNSFKRILQDKSAILNFLFSLWFLGSTGNVPEGETFGQLVDAEGNPSTPQEHFDVKADAVNNPASKVALGERNLDIFFSFPAPAGSIRISVGLLLKS